MVVVVLLVGPLALPRASEGGFWPCLTFLAVAGGLLGAAFARGPVMAWLLPSCTLPFLFLLRVSFGIVATLLKGLPGGCGSGRYIVDLK